MRRSIIWISIVTFTSQAVAQIPGLDNMQGLPNTSGAEYFVGRIEGTPLITVNLLGGVRHPGIYHIPVQTNLTQLFSYAGGVAEGAALDDVTVRSQKASLLITKNYDVEDMLEDNEGLPMLQDHDTVYMPVKKDPLMTTGLWVGILSGVATLIISGYIISTYQK